MIVRESFPANRFGAPTKLLDIYCNPEAPVVVNGEKVLEAAKRIKSGIVHTSCTYSKMSKALNMDLYLKKDYLQITGSFKERGARNTLLNLTQEEQNQGVITTSAGNHAQALAYHGADLGVSVTVCMPTIAPLVKTRNINLYFINKR